MSISLQLLTAAQLDHFGLLRSARAPLEAVTGRQIACLTFSVPASVSARWAAGDAKTRETIEEIMTAARSEAVQWLLDQRAFVKRKSGLPAGDIAAVSCRHEKGRDGSISLHDHVFINLHGLRNKALQRAIRVATTGYDGAVLDSVEALAPAYDLTYAAPMSASIGASQERAAP